MFHSKVFGALAGLVFMVGCSAAPPQDSTEDLSADDEDTSEEALSSSPRSTYYVARRDFRKCRSSSKAGPCDLATLTLVGRQDGCERSEPRCPQDPARGVPRDAQRSSSR